MSFYDAIRVGASGAADFEVERSLRFNDDDTAYLSRNFQSGGNRKKWTFSAWIKRGNLGGSAGEMRIFGGSTNASHIFITSNNALTWDVAAPGSSASANLTTTQLFRDVSAWYHLVCAFDTDNSTANNRMRIYINGTEVTSFGTRTNPSSGYAANAINADAFADGDRSLHTIGYRTSVQGSAGMEFDGYMAEINFIDGQQYDPSYFGETDAITGQWNPKEYVGGYGTTGFYLNFSDNSGTTATTLGKDSSGNGNNFTPNNFATTDAVKDTPTNNFCVLNQQDNNLSEASPHFVYTEGNLKVAWSFSGTNFDRAYGTLFIEPSDTNKYYWEATGTQNNEQMQWGVVATDTAAYRANNRNTNPTKEANIAIAMWQPYTDNGIYAIDNSGGTYGDKLTLSNGAPANGDIFSFVYDAAAGKFYVFFKGVEPTGQNYSAGTTLFDTLDTSKTYAVHNLQGDGGVSTKSGNFVMNWGQDSSFAGAKTAQGNTDASGIGDFYYSVPSGAKALCSANLPNPTISLPNKYFDTLLYTGNATDDRDITGLNFQPDWLWIKERSGTESHLLFNSVVGTSDFLKTNSSAAQGNDPNALQAFNSNGFQIGTSTELNANSETYVAWNWDAGETDGKTYTVTVVDDSGNKFRFDGFGTSAVTLDLAEGGTYIFNYPSGHPFRFSTTADGTHGGGSEYTTGVTHNSSTQVTIVVAASAPTLYYYCSSHSGMGGQVNTNSTLGSSNFDGSIQTTVKVNASAGFSIVTFSGSGNRTIGHGLGVAPKAIIMKGRNVSDQWTVGHQELDASNPWHKGIPLNTDASTQDNATFWNDTAPTSTVFSKGTWNDSYNMVAYCFSEVAGYSKFGSYTGNGNADGTFVFLGFRPAWIMLKRIDSSNNWHIADNKRQNPFNVVTAQIYPNLANAEVAQNDLDIVSNGFKIRNSAAFENANGGTYIYLAFAESPFKNARAR